MSIRTFILILTTAFMVAGVDAAAAQEKFTTPSSDRSKWTNQLLVLLDDDASNTKTRAFVSSVMERKVSDIPIPAFTDPVPTSVGTLLTMQLTQVPDSLKSVETTRSKLGRYLILSFPESVDMGELLERVAAEPGVVHASLVETIDRIDIRENAIDETKNTNFAIMQSNSVITQNKTWGFDEVEAGEGQKWQRGHAYVGIADFGLREDHAEFIDYIGNTWKGGNFHNHLSFSAGANFSGGTSSPNPYSGSVVAGKVDSYNTVLVPGDPTTCETGDTNSTVENKSVGHGSHVTGILAANATNGVGVKGVCRHCPLAIAEYRYPGPCETGTHPDGISTYETIAVQSNATVFGSIGFLIDIGVQVINHSGGIWNMDNDAATQNRRFCDDSPNDFRCLILVYAGEREVVYVASSGNRALDQQNWPAADKRVFGASGYTYAAGGGFWAGSAGNGSNYGTNKGNGPAFSAPAVDVYSTMYQGKFYNQSAGCEESNDGVVDDYGYCTGTSMSAPFISGIAAMVRSTIPTSTVDDVKEVMKASTGQTSYSPKLGWGVPQARVAVRDVALAYSDGTQVKNRLTPLFAMKSNVAKDIVHTTKPQVAASFNLNQVWQYSPYNSESAVSNYSFPESPNNPTIGSPRADLFVFTNHKKPNSQTLGVQPIYRMRYIGGATNNADWVIATESEITGSSSFAAAGYEMDGLEGYIYKICSPEPSCIPTGAVKVYRAWNSTKDDHAVFPASRYASMLTSGYNIDITMLGYAYPNINSDSDQLIDGMELLLGTDKNDPDSDCDGLSDSDEYPQYGYPQSDPLVGSC